MAVRSVLVNGVLTLWDNFPCSGLEVSFSFALKSSEKQVSEYQCPDCGTAWTISIYPLAIGVDIDSWLENIGPAIGEIHMAVRWTWTSSREWHSHSEGDLNLIDFQWNFPLEGWDMMVVSPRAGQNIVNGITLSPWWRRTCPSIEEVYVKRRKKGLFLDVHPLDVQTLDGAYQIDIPDRPLPVSYLLAGLARILQSSGCVDNSLREAYANLIQLSLGTVSESESRDLQAWIERQKSFPSQYSREGAIGVPCGRFYPSEAVAAGGGKTFFYFKLCFHEPGFKPNADYFSKDYQPLLGKPGKETISTSFAYQEAATAAEEWLQYNFPSVVEEDDSSIEPETIMTDQKRIWFKRLENVTIVVFPYAAPYAETLENQLGFEESVIANPLSLPVQSNAVQARESFETRLRTYFDFVYNDTAGFVFDRERLAELISAIFDYPNLRKIAISNLHISENDFDMALILESLGYR